jgi:hypothetical protein
MFQHTNLNFLNYFMDKDPWKQTYQNACLGELPGFPSFLRPRTMRELECPLRCICLPPGHAILLSRICFSQQPRKSCGLNLHTQPPSDWCKPQLPEVLRSVYSHLPFRYGITHCFQGSWVLWVIFLKLQYITSAVWKWGVSSGVGGNNRQTSWRKWWKTQKKNTFAFSLLLHFSIH